MNMARVIDGVVTNIEVVSEEWLDLNQPNSDVLFVVYGDDNPAHIGLSWDQINGFEQPIPIDPNDITP
jgi:hypothetical protein